MTSNYTISTSWVAPGQSALNFSSANCDEGAAWVGAATKGLDTANLRYNISLGLTVTYLRTLVPDDWMAPTDTDLIAWYTEVIASPSIPRGNNTLDYILSLPLEKCSSVICTKIDWEGDPDVSGEGMIVSYYLSGVLATIYFVSLIWTIVGRYNVRWTEHRAARRVFSAIQESSNTFLDAALVFAVAMLGAAAVRFYDVMSDPKEGQSAYATLGSVSMSVFSLFPALVLQAVTDGQRTHILRQFLWFAAIALTIAVEIMYRQTFKVHQMPLNQSNASFENVTLQSVWSRYCEDSTLRERLKTGLTISHAVLGLQCLWWLYYLLVTVLPQHWHESMGQTRVGRFFAHCRRWLRALDGIVCLAVMWMLLSLFQRYRDSIQAATGQSNIDNAWTFGQVLALATWAPVFVDVVGILIYGPEKGLDKKISDKYRIVPASQSRASTMEKSTYGPLNNQAV